MKFILLAISIAFNLWLASAVVRLENFHYGVALGLCSQEERDAIQNLIERDHYIQCLKEAQTRTSSWYQLVYGLDIL